MKKLNTLALFLFANLALVSNAFAGPSVNEITINNAKDVYGYKITGKLSQPNGMTSTVVYTFNCDGSHESDQSVTISGRTMNAEKRKGNSDKAPTIVKGWGNSAGKSILSWMNDSDNGSSFILTDDKKIVVGVTKVAGLKTSEVTKIEQIATCK